MSWTLGLLLIAAMIAICVAAARGAQLVSIHRRHPDLRLREAWNVFHGLHPDGRNHEWKRLHGSSQTWHTCDRHPCTCVIRQCIICLEVHEEDKLPQQRW